MKLARHEKILELIRQNTIETQEELARELNAAGFKTTQATVSRDIRELKLSKSAGPDGRSRYVQPAEKDDLGNTYIRAFQTAFLSMDTAQNLLVIHTVSGMAMAGAAALDELHLAEIVGCIAGDNTIFCAARSTEDAVKVMEKIRDMM